MDATQIKSIDIQPEEIKTLLEYFSKNTYKARDTHPKVQRIMDKCLELFSLDYDYSIISNGSGELSTNYPSKLVILEREKGESKPEDILELETNGRSLDHSFDVPQINTPEGVAANGIDLTLESESFIGTSLPTASYSFKTSSDIITPDTLKLKDLCSKARFARCRARFPVPVILYKRTHICRSATLSGGPEIYGRSSFDYFFSGGADNKQFYNETDGNDDEIIVPETQSDWQLFDRVRSQDIRLLKSFGVCTIVDLMVEKKKVKFGVNVTSSEKVDKENRYGEFNLVCLPYPGCEFFREYRDKGYSAEDLVFEWNQGHVDANICVPQDDVSTELSIDWSQYREWDLVALTQKYVKLLLAYIKTGNKGLLIHCISGWDRTPLFISLLRLSLWADGVIHKSLNPEQILYLTLSYDWLLFGHNLEDRLSKGEEIMFFCFYFLKYLVEAHFSIEEPEPNNETPTTSLAEVLPSINEDALNKARVRNDSDIHLDGVLLDGDNQTSPEGSNWSLNSGDSSQSSKSCEPPSTFKIPFEPWEESKNDDPMHFSCKCNMSREEVQNKHRSAPLKIVDSDESPPFKSSNGSYVNLESFSYTSSSNLHSRLSSGSSHSSQDESGVKVGRGRTSPVAVPIPTKSSHGFKPESTSSASIGSWQMVAGTESLREVISSSEPGSNSNASQTPVGRLHFSNGSDWKEASESSCTLVEESVKEELLNSLDTNCQKSETPKKDSKEEREEKSEIQSSPEKWDMLSTPVNASPSKPSILSRRREKLQTVRAQFYTLYASAIGFKFRNVNDNGSRSGGFAFFGNLLGSSKSDHRSTSRVTSN